jgi:uncharacterized protein (DUF305 family)
MSFRKVRRSAATTALAIASAGLSAAAPALHAQTPKKDYTPADAKFMQGMIVHHAQAVVMSDWAESHGASPALVTLCKRISLSQYDEIDLMQRWLAARNLSYPDPLWMHKPHRGAVVDPSPMHMPGMDMGNPPMMMSGMLTPAEMHALNAAHGVKFDSLYLVGMIKHHQGAIDMVRDLFATPGGGQQAELSGFATDIDASQRAQIHRMQLMLQALPTTSSPSK